VATVDAMKWGSWYQKIVSQIAGKSSFRFSAFPASKKNSASAELNII
jgi:hypothetical protein